MNAKTIRRGVFDRAWMRASGHADCNFGHHTMLMTGRHFGQTLVRRTCRHLGVIGCAIVMCVATLSAQAAGAQYVYDSGNRLVQVISANGTSAQYSYDAAGNLLGVTPLSVTTAAVTGFSSTSAAVGSTITIYGSGFSTTITNDTVTVGGVSATIVSATANSLTVIVPTGATNGTVTVTSPNGTKTSTFQLIVAPPLFAPVIASFTPQQGVVGTAVTINGSNFLATAANDAVYFARVVGTASSASAGVLGATVPTGASSGKISVATPNGVATSANDFFVLPTGYTISNIGPTGRLVVDGAPLTITFSTAGKTGIFLFDGVIGQRISLQVSGGTFQSDCSTASVGLFSPGPSNLGVLGLPAATLCTGSEVFVLPSTGTYTLYIQPAATDTGSVTLMVSNQQLVTGSIAIGGPPVTVSTTASQLEQLTFTSTSTNQTISVQVSGNTYVNCSNAFVYVTEPIPGAVSDLGGGSNACTGAFLVFLPTVGTYTINVTPFGAGSITVQLRNAPLVTQSIAIDGAPVNVATTVPAQQAQLTFTNSAANKQIQVQVSGNSYPTCGSTAVQVYAPGTSASYLLDGRYICTGTYVVDLPTAGTYTILVTPSGLDTGNVTFQLSSVQPVTASISIDGQPVTVTMTIPAQQAQLTFTSTSANQVISVQPSGSTYPSCGDAQVDVYEGTSNSTTLVGLGSTVCATNPFLASLPTVGTYTILVQPYGSETGSVTIKLANAPTVTAPISIGGSAVTVTTTVPAQRAQLTFNSSSANQVVSLQVTSNTYPTCNSTSVYVEGPSPSNTWATSWYVCTATYQMTLPTVGTYTIGVLPSGADTGSITFQLH